MQVKVKKMRSNAVLPSKAHASDAGYDLVATSRHTDACGNIVYGTGLAFEIPEGYVGLLFPRSSIANKDVMLTNAVGVIDSGYRGEVMAKFKPTLRGKEIKYIDNCVAPIKPTSVVKYNVNERIGQLIIMPIPDIEFVESDHLSMSDRGEGGYGSSGK